MSRFNVTNKIEALPGCCFICHSSNRNAYVDTGINIEYEGAIFICDTCMSEMAGLLNFLSPDTHNDVKEKYKVLLAAYEQLLISFKRMGVNIDNISSELSMLYTTYGTLPDSLRKISGLSTSRAKATD
jgi:hypothetical protein